MKYYLCFIFLSLNFSLKAQTFKIIKAEPTKDAEWISDVQQSRLQKYIGMTVKLIVNKNSATMTISGTKRTFYLKKKSDEVYALQESNDHESSSWELVLSRKLSFTTSIWIKNRYVAWKTYTDIVNDTSYELTADRF